MVRIIRNVGGIEGLHLATDCFTEDVERRIFSSINESTYQTGKRTWGGQPTGLLHWPSDWPDDYIKLTNLVRDCGLLPDYVPPNYCLRLMYPPKAGFQLHHDSKYRWGEVIVGVNLGQEGEMMFTPDNPQINAFHPAAFTSELASKSAGVGKSMRIKLPRRSIYVMSGPSRYVYKHGIAQQKPMRPPPSWNKWNMRKSLTFRSTKVFSDVYLERQLINTTNNTTKRMELQRRKEAQDKYKAKGIKAQVAQERQNATLLLNMMDSGIIPSQLRFDRREVTFDVAPGVVAQQRQQQPKYLEYSRSQFGTVGIGGGSGIVSAAAPVAATAAFQGEGRQLGSSINHGGGDDDNNIMQMAINASLRSLAEERAARSEKRKRRRNRGSDEGASKSCKDKEEGVASPKTRSGGAAGTVCGGVIDLVGDGGSDDEEETKNGDYYEKDSDIIVIHE